MECREAQDALEEYRREALSDRAGAAIRAHLAQCDRCRTLHEADTTLGAALRLKLPRHAAPAALRRQILRVARRGRGRFALSNPWVSAAVAAGLTLVLVLPFLLRGRPDPLQALAAEVISEHVRSVLAEETEGSGENYKGVVQRLRAKTGVTLRWFYPGDPEIKLVYARPVLVLGKKGLGLLYQDQSGRMATYLVFPGEEVKVPATGRVKVADFNPYAGKADGYSLLLWKQEGLNCVLISDWDRDRFLQLFLNIRRAAGPSL